MYFGNLSSARFRDAEKPCESLGGRPCLIRLSPRVFSRLKRPVSEFPIRAEVALPARRVRVHPARYSPFVLVAQYRFAARLDGRGFSTAVGCLCTAGVTGASLASGPGCEAGISFRKKRVPSHSAALAVMGGFDFHPRVVPPSREGAIWRLLWKVFYFVRKSAKSTTARPRRRR